MHLIVCDLFKLYVCFLNLLTTGTCTPFTTSVMEAVPSQETSVDKSTFTLLSTVVRTVTVTSTNYCSMEEYASPMAMWIGISGLLIFLSSIMTIVSVVLGCILCFKKRTTQGREVHKEHEYAKPGKQAVASPSLPICIASVHAICI